MPEAHQTRELMTVDHESCRLIGGELFDHILAHRYLKEKDACRLFAQLMSGVHYLHSKHIVHRDLKLVCLIEHAPFIFCIGAMINVHSLIMTYACYI